LLTLRAGPVSSFYNSTIHSSLSKSESAMYIKIGPQCVLTKQCERIMHEWHL
jgi:hypothetical protein